LQCRVTRIYREVDAGIPTSVRVADRSVNGRRELRPDFRNRISSRGGDKSPRH
jgi:hypothetical protein